MIVVAAALGLLTYYGVIGYSAFRFFPEEIHHAMVFSSWIPFSTFFWTALGTRIIFAGIARALRSAVVGTGRIQVLAITHLPFALIFSVIALGAALLLLIAINPALVMLPRIAGT